MTKASQCSFNGHPPLGVNATMSLKQFDEQHLGFNGHPPLGVNATTALYRHARSSTDSVSMGTHPWG